MYFEEIITDEFLNYKKGFVNGKSDFLTSITSNTILENFSNNEDWDSIGYEDGFNLYLDYYIENNVIPIELILGEEAYQIIKVSFIERVIEYNQNAIENIPAIKMKIKL